MNETIRKLLCTLLCLMLLLSAASSAFAAEDSDTIEIRAAEDLVELAQNCALNSWSDGVRVVLLNDISLSNVAFEPIPVFNGSFDGGGHTIYDLSLTAAQSPCGLFIETEKDAVIRDLKVTGTVTPRGDDSRVGGLVGLNRGTLINCSFSGSVEAQSRVGGVVGENEASGLISLCSSYGSVFGFAETGGVVGYNSGALAGCENNAFVNTKSVDPALRLDSIDTSSILNFLQSIRSDNADITSEIGGVCGVSCGFVEGCANRGTVGYLHLGYHVGGIVGHSSGYLDRCENTGVVYGRRAVGGIVGLAEPYIVTEETKNLLSSLSYRFAALNNAIETAIEDAGDSSEEIVAQLNTLAGVMSPAAASLHALDPSDPDTLDAFRNTLADCINAASGSMNGITDRLDDSSGVLVDDFQQINNQISALSGTAVQAMSMLSGAEETDILSDNSDENLSAEITLGKTKDCVNSAEIYGDRFVGGIAGAISLDSEMKESSLLNSSGNSLVKNRYSLHASVLKCINRGSVSARHECAGGICGRMDFGYLGSCASYGTVSIEEGDYAGGICGLGYGSVKTSCAKCTLSAKRYVGGILGNGYDAIKNDERSSVVSGCYSLVQILDDPQFAGAISGGGSGSYENNYFVPMGFAGLNKLSIQGEAEPMAFSDFSAVEGLPEECRSFHLRFLVDDSVVKEVPFGYGDSFDRTVFPIVEKRNGSYAVWDRTDLNDLRFDTDVHAVFRMDETVLSSTLVREDGRAAVYLDGQFQIGDELAVESLSISDDEINNFRGTWRDTVREQLSSIFRDRDPDYSVCIAVAEKLRLQFPDDGLTSHTVRYLAPDTLTNNHRLYLYAESGWQRLHPTVFGSYYLFDVGEKEAEFALVSTIQSWWIVAYVAGALAILALLLYVIFRFRNSIKGRKGQNREKPEWLQRLRMWRHSHKKLCILGTAGLVLAAILIVFFVHFSSISSAISTYRLLKQFSQQETSIQIDIDVSSETRDLQLDTEVTRIRENGRMISCTQQYGIPLYFCGGRIYLENGRAFEVTGSSLDQNAVLDMAREVFRKGEISRSSENGEKRYEAKLAADQANELLHLMLSGESADILHAECMTATVIERDKAIVQLCFTGNGTTESGKAFDISAALTPQPIDTRPQIPEAVREAIERGEKGSAELITEDFLMLIAGWMRYDSADAVSADLTVEVSCGALNLDNQYTYTRQLIQDTQIHSLKGKLLKLYFTDNAVCTAQGLSVSTAEEQAAASAKLIPLAKELCLKGDFSCTGTAINRSYTVSLDGESATALAEELIPALSAMKVDLTECRLLITLEDGELSKLTLDCGGTVRIVSKDLSSTILVTADFRTEAEEEDIPSKVLEVLLPHEA